MAAGGGGDALYAARLKERGFYTRAVSVGMSFAQGESVLMVGHDMMMTPAFVKRMMEVAATDAGVGLVRGCSQYMDGCPEHQYGPVFETRGYQDVVNFSEYAARYYQQESAALRFLIGDSFLVKRAVIDRIGVMDVGFVHLFGDLDYGVRAQRAGYQIVCARGVAASRWGHVGEG